MTPHVSVWVSEGHRDICDNLSVRICRERLDLLQYFQRLLQRLMLIASQELRRNRIRKAKCPYGIGSESALRALLIDHDADDLNVGGRRDLGKNLLRVRHLRNGRRRDKTHRVNVLESRLDQLAKIAGLYLGRDIARQTLPRIARALDDLDGFIHSNHLTASKRTAASTARRINLENLPRDHHALNLAGAFANGTQLHVSIILLGGIILDESIAAKQLHGIIADAHRNLA